MIDANSLGCIICEREWPPTETYLLCPVCQEDTVESQEMPMNSELAERLASEGRFGWYLWEHDLV